MRGHGDGNFGVVRIVWAFASTSARARARNYFASTTESETFPTPAGTGIVVER